MAHTPGEWSVHPSHHGYPEIQAHHVTSPTEEGWWTIAVSTGERPEREQWANMRLFAAAPDLLAALEHLTSDACVNEITLGDVRAAQAAIAKAKGE